MNWRSEHGSITPVWVFILGMVVLLGVAIVEREWANFKLKLLEQTLDFAAEAAGQTHEGYVQVAIPREQLYWESTCVEWEDDEETVCSEWEEQKRGPRPLLPMVIEGPVAEIRDYWRELGSCGGSDATEPEWSCDIPEVECQWLEFTTDAASAATQTLWGNWKNLPTAAVHPSSVNVIPRLPPRSDCSAFARVDVSAELEMRPLFGLVPWVHRTTKIGSSVVRLHPLVLQ